MLLASSGTAITGLIGNSPAAASFAVSDVVNTFMSIVTQTASQTLQLVPYIAITGGSQLLDFLM